MFSGQRGQGGCGEPLGPDPLEGTWSLHDSRWPLGAKFHDIRPALRSTPASWSCLGSARARQTRRAKYSTCFCAPLHEPSPAATRWWCSLRPGLVLKLQLLCSRCCSLRLPSSCVWSSEDDPRWCSWPLPMTESDALFDVGLYADCIAFSKRVRAAGARATQGASGPPHHSAGEPGREERCASVLFLYVQEPQSRQAVLLQRALLGGVPAAGEGLRRPLGL